MSRGIVEFGINRRCFRNLLSVTHRQSRPRATNLVKTLRENFGKPRGNGILSMVDGSVLTEIARSHWRSNVLRTFCSLGVAEALSAEGDSVGAIAGRCGASESHLARFLSAAAVLEVCEKVGPDTFRLTPLGELCRREHPHSVRGLLLLSTSPEHTQCWMELDKVVKTGQSGVKHAFGLDNYFDLFKLRPGFVEVFEAGMAGMHETEAILKSDAFRGVAKCVEVAAGHPTLMQALLKKYPAMTGVVSDLPEVVAKMEIEEGLRARCRVAAFDFNSDRVGESVAGGDGYIIKHSVHNWGDQECVRILTKLAGCMAPHGKLFIIGSGPLPEDNTPHFSKDLDLCMMVLTGARERTIQQHKHLCAQAGLQVSRVEALQEASIFILTATKC